MALPPLHICHSQPVSECRMSPRTLPPHSQGAKHKSPPGFTLIELSIVLVIIGLIVGGILVGNDLIEAAKLRKTVTEVTNIKTAINTFRLKYNCLPGDCSTAANFFGSSCASGVATNCNGNNDSQIIWWSGNLWKAEALHAWEHLALSGLIVGSYSAVYPSNSLHVVGTQLPPAALVPGGYGLFYYDPSALLGFNNYISLGIPFTGAYNMGAVATALQSHQIDSKIDDGKPQTGRMLGQDGFIADFPTYLSETCISGNEYDFANEAISCTLSFAME